MEGSTTDLALMAAVRLASVCVVVAEGVIPWFDSQVNVGRACARCMRARIRELNKLNRPGTAW
jgi:hypothetical protein